jgi:hypothetical protein
LHRIQLRRKVARSLGIRYNTEADVGKRGIHPILICGRTPLNSSKRTALSKALLPEHLALLVRIESVRHTGLLAED